LIVTPELRDEKRILGMEILMELPQFIELWVSIQWNQSTVSLELSMNILRRFWLASLVAKDGGNPINKKISHRSLNQF